MLCEMDVKVEIKEEPVWPAETASTSRECFELQSAMVHLKEETKAELTEPGPTQPARDIKDEVFIEDHTVEQLVPLLKEENREKIVAESTEGSVDSCGVCCKPFNQSNNHKCDLPTPGPICCEKCGRTFIEKKRLTTHLRRCGESLFSCSVCSKKFTRKEAWKAHIFAHSGERPYSCSICNSKFMRKRTLNIHLRTHSEVQPYHCCFCERTFTQKSHLESHQLIHSGERPYCCSICNTKFAVKGALKRHMFVHSGESPYCCTICNKSYGEKSNLKKHLLVHAREEQYRCSVCSSTFVNRGNLTVHMNAHVRIQRALYSGVPSSTK